MHPLLPWTEMHCMQAWHATAILSVHLFLTLMNCAEMAEWIEMIFGRRPYELQNEDKNIPP